MDIFSTAFLPNVSYLHLLLNAKNPIIDLGEYYIKQTHRNRTFILASNGSIPLIIPLCKGSSKIVKDIEISYAEDWQIRYLKSIQSSYKNAPYYEHYQYEFEELFMRKEKCLHVYNHHLLNWLLTELGINLNLPFSTSYIENNILNDYRKFDFYTENENLNSNPYKQVFSYKKPFTANQSGIDLLFNKGPEAFPFI